MMMKYTAFIILPLVNLLPLLIGVAFLVLVERKLLGYAQNRKGPNIVGPWGILQTIADGVKLIIKEPTNPSLSNQILFLVCPTVAMFLAFMVWTPCYTKFSIINLNFSVLFISALSAISVYTVLGSGWASNSAYALMGSIRATAQMISYEVTLILIILPVLITFSSFNLIKVDHNQQTMWCAAPFWPLMMMWLVSSLAETNRAPFDLTEGESELVSGFNVEYSGGPFALFFLAEYMNIMMMNALSSILFLGGSTFMIQCFDNIGVPVKTLILTIWFIWVRASFPRVRYDQLMNLMWKHFLPYTLIILILAPILINFINMQ
uniref:NADH-ubiquinone oxidoreductase chain 1 n=1 Tax=Xenoturbella profunda TaxID=1736633 RepID=A0A0U2M004_9BILA|nr:NADH dehydrogenase subunit 1 [Xenoturbella profunda]ALS20092.1 NADH dehydrogenase subunit 1 [Xenoturbella profunda]